MDVGCVPGAGLAGAGEVAFELGDALRVVSGLDRGGLQRGLERFDFGLARFERAEFLLRVRELLVQLGGALLVGGGCGGGAQQRGLQRFDLAGLLGASLLLFNRLGVSGVDLCLQPRLGVGLVAGGGLAGGRELASSSVARCWWSAASAVAVCECGLQRLDLGLAVLGSAA